MFGRRKKDTDELGAGSHEEAELGEALGAAPPARTGGPIDAADLDPNAVFADLGSLLVQPVDGLELRMPVDEDGTPLAVLMVADEGVIEMRAFASARGGDLWDDARRDIAADTTERGGTVVEQEGPFGVELLAHVPVTSPEGENYIQPTRVLGISGPRWFLRATIAGRPAIDAEFAAPYEEVLRTLAVRRGNEALAPGTALPLRLPPDARRTDA